MTSDCRASSHHLTRSRGHSRFPLPPPGLDGFAATNPERKARGLAAVSTYPRVPQMGSQQRCASCEQDSLVVHTCTQGLREDKLVLRENLFVRPLLIVILCQEHHACQECKKPQWYARPATMLI